MSAMNDPQDSAQTGGAAIARLLRAEQELRDSLADAQQQASVILERAAWQAAEIARRAEQRTLAVHGRCAQSLEQRIQRLQGGDAPSPEADPAGARFDVAVARVAKWLTGAVDDNGD